LEEGDRMKVSQLFIFMHIIDVGCGGLGSRRVVREWEDGPTGQGREPPLVHDGGQGVQGGRRVASPRTVTWVDHTLPRRHRRHVAVHRKMPPDGFHPPIGGQYDLVWASNESYSKRGWPHRLPPTKTGQHDTKVTQRHRINCSLHFEIYDYYW
jgi:hypothetical protein